MKVLNVINQATPAHAHARLGSVMSSLLVSCLLAISAVAVVIAG